MSVPRWSVPYVVVALTLSACAAAPDVTRSAEASASAPASSRSQPSVAAAAGVWRPAAEPRVVAAGLRAPWSVVPLPDGSQLVAERDSGSIVEVAADGTSRVLGTVPGVVPGGEAGLHGLAVSPDGAWLYAYHGASADNRVVRMALDATSGRRALGAVEVVLGGIPRASTHNGGRMAFGPEGHLYVTTGDAQLSDAAQDPSSLAGKILRVTAESAPAPGNPFGTAVYSLGHRNVQGIAWTADGAMWASEFGQSTFDEINRIRPGGNYGWPKHEGVSGDPAFIDPVVEWATAEASPSGLAASGRTLFAAGLRGERVWMLDVADDALSGPPVPLWSGEFGRMRDAVVAGDALWSLTSNTDSRGAPRSGDDLLLRVPLAPG